MAHHCNDGSSGHDHDHGHGHDNPDVGPKDNLFERIDRPNVVALNAGEGRGPEVIKPWHERNDTNSSLVSEEDGEMIIRVPFTGTVNLHSLLLKTGAGERAQVKVSLFPNQDNLDFDDVQDRKATQVFDIARGNPSVGAYNIIRAKFSNLSSITLFFHSDDGAEQTEIFYVGLLGHWNELKQSAVITVYETQANLADHEKIQGTEGALSSPHT